MNKEKLQINIKNQNTELSDELETPLSINPLKKGNLTIVLFGASGDLSKRKIIPALYSLYASNSLPDTVRIVGYARSSKK
jgi:hypothetical protein